MAHSAAPADRVDWVDYGKGFCIIFVVMMHSTLGVEKAMGDTGWMGLVVEWARPFRMPDFFLIAGLFLARSIGRDWGDYLDRKGLHFVYFYVLWLTIQFAFKAPGMAAQAGWDGALFAYLHAYVDPFGTLWFIYLLPVFFVVTKLVRKVPPVFIWGLAAGLEIADLHTGNLLIDEFASRYVYFFTGYLLAPMIFRFAAWAQNNLEVTGLGLAVWAVFNGILVFSGFGDLPFVSLALGFLGAAAVVGLSALLSRSDLMAPIRYCGEHSIIIYLGFFLPMAVARSMLIRSGPIQDVGTISMLVTIAGVVGALLMWWAVRDTRLRFLYVRPDWARRVPSWKQPLQPAE